MPLNCWEVMKCGRQPGGKKTKKLGICPAATFDPARQINNGENAGRICWAIAGTFCGDKVQGSFAEKEGFCLECDFFKKVREEEGSGFTLILHQNIPTMEED